MATRNLLAENRELRRKLQEAIRQRDEALQGGASGKQPHVGHGKAAPASPKILDSHKVGG